jgi:hypothetical protein
MFLALLLITGGCGNYENGVAGGEDFEKQVVNEVPLPSPSPEAEINDPPPQYVPPAPLTPESPSNQAPVENIQFTPAVSLLQQSHQNYAEQFGIDPQAVQASWNTHLNGVSPPAIDNAAEINQFFQFVRETGGADFQSHNEKAATANAVAQNLLYVILTAQDKAALETLHTNLVVQKEEARWMKRRILKTAGIYGVKMTDVSENQDIQNLINDIDAFSTDITSQIEISFDKANVKIGKNSGQLIEDIQQDLEKLLQASTVFSAASLVLNKSHFHSFLSFVPAGAEDCSENKFQVKNRFYGAFATQFLRFAVPPNTLKQEI